MGTFSFDIVQSRDTTVFKPQTWTVLSSLTYREATLFNPSSMTQTCTPVRKMSASSVHTHARTHLPPSPHTHQCTTKPPCPSLNITVSFLQHPSAIFPTPQSPLNTPNCTSQHSQLHLSTLQYLFLLLKSPVSFSEHHTVLSSHPSVLFTPQCPFLHTPPSFCSHQYILLVTPLCPSVHTPVSFSSHPSVLFFTPQRPSVHTPISFSSHPYLLLFTPLRPSLHTPVSFSSHPSVLLLPPQCPSLSTTVFVYHYHHHHHTDNNNNDDDTNKIGNFKSV